VPQLPHTFDPEAGMGGGMPMPFSWASSPAFLGIVDARYGHGVLVRSRTVIHLQ